MGDDVRFGDLLRSYRVAAGLTQETLAEMAGLSLRGVSDLERSVRKVPHTDTLRRLADALELKETERRSLLIFARRRRKPMGGVPYEPPRLRTPRSLSNFIGRGREIEEIAALLKANRLVTLTGAGGIGKSRLAFEVARGGEEIHRNGAAVVELAPLIEPALVPQAVATVLQIGDQSARSPLATLLQALESAELLLVLDNCEHLINACAELVESVLRGSPDVRVLATSREPLGVSGEITWRVRSLSLPALDGQSSPDKILHSEAVRLFVQRARQVRPGFEVTNENAGAIAAVCHRLEGIPLAIELAAARITALSVDEIAARLDDCLQLLASNNRTAPLRHQTLQATLDWSYGLLTEPERTLLNRAAVFADGWTLNAAEAVCTGGVIDKQSVLRLLAALVDKSMVVVSDQTRAGTRYRLLEPIRQYAVGKLRGAGEEQSVRDRHMAWCLDLAREGDLGLIGPDQENWLVRLKLELDNIRAALAWSRDQTHQREAALTVATSLMRFWRYAGYPNEGCSWLTALARDVSPVARASAMAAAAYVRDHQGDHAGAWQCIEEALPLARRLNHPALLAQVLCTLGRLRLHAGQAAEAMAALEEALALADGTWTSYAHLNLGFAAQALGQSTRALAHYQEALRRASERQDQFSTAVVHRALGGLLLDLGQLAVARQNLEQALVLSRGMPTSPNVAPTIALLAGLAVADGDFTRAFKLAGAANGLKAAVEARLLPSDLATLESRLERARRILDPEVVEALWAEGAALNQAEAIDYALAGERPKRNGPLTEREMQVALLVAQGLSNHDVAKRLVISEGTAKRHVENLLGKLNLRSRAQVADWITYHGNISKMCRASS